MGVKKKLAPICLFTYKRLAETIKTVEALRNNYLASESDLFIFSDNAKSEVDLIKVIEVRNYLCTIDGFNSVQIIKSEQNNGLAKSVILGVSKIIDLFGKVIVLEDDLITSKNFLDFMNMALFFYENNQKIYSISGYTMNLTSNKTSNQDYYIAYRASSWGWGTWKDRWDTIDWDAKLYRKTLVNPLMHIKFLRGGSDMPMMLWKQMNGKLDSWAIRWCFQQFIDNKYTIYPTKSKVVNIGFGNNATNTSIAKNKFLVLLENCDVINFKFDENIKLKPLILYEFYLKFSFFKRIIEKISGF